MLAIARRWLGLPSIGYFGDIRMLALQGNEQIVWDAFSWLVNLLGWNFDPSKDSVMSPPGDFPGFHENYSTVQRADEFDT